MGRELTPSSIRITSGGKSILIDDESGIYVTSDKDIEITGGNAVEITSLNGSVVMMGSDTVTVGQKDALVELNDENVIFKGAQTKAD
jgi:uncharacterized protein (DUF2345 family)